MSILKWFGLAGEFPGRAPVGDTDTVRRIVQEFDRLPPADARYVAAFAYILGRVAMADLAISPDETRAMERIVTERGGLPEEQAVIVVQMAKSQNQLFGGTEDFLVPASSTRWRATSRSSTCSSVCSPLRPRTRRLRWPRTRRLPESPPSSRSTTPTWSGPASRTGSTCRCSGAQVLAVTASERSPTATDRGRASATTANSASGQGPPS